MSEISPKDAREKYGIYTKHEGMENGEARFRLIGPDGSKYVRTVAGEQGAWQKSHWHNRVRESYIIQDGWMGYAELAGEGVKVKVFVPGNILTTQPGVVHNVYLPRGGVTHTVKHGDTRRDDWHPYSRFDEMTRGMSEEEIWKLAGGKSRQQVGSSKYSEEYRHFDNLIWQAPAWCTAIFVAALIGTANIDKDIALLAYTRLSAKSLLGIFLGIIFFFMLALTHALYRFRWHQAPMKKDDTPLLASGQFYLHLMVRVQASCILAVLCVLGGLSYWGAGLASVALVGGLTVYNELGVRGGDLLSRVVVRVRDWIGGD